MWPNLEWLSNKSEVWCSRGILFTLGGLEAIPGTFQKLTCLSCNLGHSVVVLMKFLKAILLRALMEKSEVFQIKSEVWCGRDSVLMLGGWGGTPRKIFKN